MLEQKRLTSFFQPIVYAADPHRIFAHEALLRGLGSDNELISPGRILPVAKSTGLLFQVDRAARMCAIQESVNCDLDSLVFINFMPTAIYDPVNCLQSTVRLITELKLPPERFVFEVVESEEVQEVDHLRNILDFYRRSGFGVALDDLGAGYASLNRVGELKPDYVKLDMKLIQGVHLDPFKAIIADRILSLARDLGIRTIVEGVEQPEELAWAQEHKADFVQGYYIARPANPPFKPSLKKS
jgi:EAL domain-containing protein (putative c-di-GMP-specific phosphodiesterase class I)